MPGPLDYRYGVRGWTAQAPGSRHAIRLTEAELISNLKTDGWRDTDIALLIYAERLNHRAAQLLKRIENDPA
jgi:hypothetical protein